MVAGVHLNKLQMPPLEKWISVMYKSLFWDTDYYVTSAWQLKSHSKYTGQSKMILNHWYNYYQAFEKSVMKATV